MATSLKRADTERPKTSSPVRSDAQMSTLNEALTNAKKEIESQGVRLRDLEALLNEERRAREDAEERANRLERESSKDREPKDLPLPNGSIHNIESTAPESEKTIASEDGPASPNNSDDTTTRLQQRLDLMMLEMNEMKQQMERYRERAETAEADRKSLAEMIENIREDNAKTASKEANRRNRSDGQLARDGAKSGMDGSEDEDEELEGEITIIRDEDLDQDGTGLVLGEAQNGHAVEHNTTQQTSKSSNILATRRPDRDLMYHGGPIGAIVTVVALGVAVMAMLNQYPKTER